MSIVTATRKAFGSRWPGKVSTDVQADRELIAREARKAELEDFRRECRDELQQATLSPARREAVHALLRESYRSEGYRDDLIFDCGVMRRKQE